MLRLDDVLPAGWALLSAGEDPWGGVDSEFAAALRVRGCQALTVLGPGGLDAWVGEAVEDLDGALLRMLRPGVTGLVRPDRFFAGIGDAATLADAFARVLGG